MAGMICPWCEEGDHVRCTLRPPCLCTDLFHAPEPAAIIPLPPGATVIATHQVKFKGMAEDTAAIPEQP